MIFMFIQNFLRDRSHHHEWYCHLELRKKNYLRNSLLNMYDTVFVLPNTKIRKQIFKFGTSFLVSNMNDWLLDIEFNHFYFEILCRVSRSYYS